MGQRTRIVIPYDPRPLQTVIHKAMDGRRRGIVLCHRRFGKTVCAVNHLIREAVRCPLERPRFAYVAPTYAMGKDVAWDYLKHFAAPIPGRRFNESELRIDFPHPKGETSRVRIYGSEDPDKLRGRYYDGVVLDEYGLMRPETLPEVIGPTLIDRQGWALVMGTPKGKNQFWRDWQKALRNQSWYTAAYPASQTGILSEEYLAQERKEMTEDEYAQEYECSFEASVKGAVFAKEMLRVRQEGRITAVPYDPTLPVDTNWDLGYRDATAIWFSQSTYGGAVRLIDYYQNTGEGIDHYLQYVQGKPYTYGEHWFPHDVEQHELGTGRRLIDLVRMKLRNVNVATRLEFSDSLHALRMFLPRCYFDDARCERGLDALTSYRWHYNAELKEFTNKPEHDWASHGADALRTLAVRYDPAIRKAERELKRDSGELDHRRMLRHEYGYQPPRQPSLRRGGY